jgi:hypothetical protein
MNFLSRPIVPIFRLSMCVLVLSICNLLIMTSCDPLPPEFPVGEVMGYRPMYASEFDTDGIRVTDSQPVKNPGKIYYYGSYLFLNESGKGVHIINNADPSNPQKMKFLEIPGVGDISIRGNVMYANSFRDLLSINITDLNNITEIGRLSNVFSEVFMLPPEGGYFECIDPNKGRIVGWAFQLLNNPECYY